MQSLLVESNANAGCAMDAKALHSIHSLLQLKAKASPPPPLPSLPLPPAANHPLQLQLTQAALQTHSAHDEQQQQQQLAQFVRMLSDHIQQQQQNSPSGANGSASPQQQQQQNWDSGEFARRYEAEYKQCLARYAAIFAAAFSGSSTPGAGGKKDETSGNGAASGGCGWPVSSSSSSSGASSASSLTPPSTNNNVPLDASPAFVPRASLQSGPALPPIAHMLTPHMSPARLSSGGVGLGFGVGGQAPLTPPPAHGHGSPPALHQPQLQGLGQAFGGQNPLAGMLETLCRSWMTGAGSGGCGQAQGPLPLGAGAASLGGMGNSGGDQEEKSAFGPPGASMWDAALFLKQLSGSRSGPGGIMGLPMPGAFPALHSESPPPLHSQQSCSPDSGLSGVPTEAQAQMAIARELLQQCANANAAGGAAGQQPAIVREMLQNLQSLMVAQSLSAPAHSASNGFSKIPLPPPSSSMSLPMSLHDLPKLAPPPTLPSQLSLPHGPAGGLLGGPAGLDMGLGFNGFACGMPLPLSLPPHPLSLAALGGSRLEQLASGSGAGVGMGSLQSPSVGSLGSGGVSVSGLGGAGGASSSPRFQCELCQKSYSTLNGLAKHRQLHCAAHTKKQFNCKYCDKTYVSLGALKMHIRTHTLPCKCQICGKAFSRCVASPRVPSLLYATPLS